jgi:hypothetical protein
MRLMHWALQNVKTPPHKTVRLAHNLKWHLMNSFRSLDQEENDCLVKSDLPKEFD